MNYPKLILGIMVLMALTFILINTSFAQTNWVKYEGNPVLEPSGYDEYVGSPCGIKDGEIFKMWYSGGDEDAICYATSTDGINWQKYGGNPVLVGDEGTWEDGEVSGPSVIKENGIYKMWYGAKGIGYATSTDGIHWTKYEENPVLKVGPSGSWDAGEIGYPSVIKEGQIYKMWYEAEGEEGGEFGSIEEQIGYATSTDGIHWTKYEENPVLEVGPSGSWDDLAVGSPCVIYHEDIYMMWYGGWSSKFDHPSSIGFVTSLDGINWKKYEENPVLSSIGLSYETTPGDPWVIQDGDTLKIWYSEKECIYYAYEGLECSTWADVKNKISCFRNGQCTLRDVIDCFREWRATDTGR